MRKLVALLLCLTFPSMALAEDALLNFELQPPMTIYTTDKGTMACYDFERAKAAKVADAENALSLRKLSLMESQVADLKVAGDKLMKAVRDLESLNRDLTTDLNAAIVLRDEAIVIATVAKKRDVLGGGVKYLIGTGVVAAGVGILVGVLVTKKTNPPAPVMGKITQ